MRPPSWVGLPAPTPYTWQQSLLSIPAASPQPSPLGGELKGSRLGCGGKRNEKSEMASGAHGAAGPGEHCPLADDGPRRGTRGTVKAEGCRATAASPLYRSRRRWVNEPPGPRFSSPAQWRCGDYVRWSTGNIQHGVQHPGSDMPLVCFSYCKLHLSARSERAQSGKSPRCRPSVGTGAGVMLTAAVRMPCTCVLGWAPPPPPPPGAARTLQARCFPAPWGARAAALRTLCDL